MKKKNKIRQYESLFNQKSVFLVVVDFFTSIRSKLYSFNGQTPHRSDQFSCASSDWCVCVSSIDEHLQLSKLYANKNFHTS